jgi:hypothetical protein
LQFSLQAASPVTLGYALVLAANLNIWTGTHSGYNHQLKLPTHLLFKITLLVSRFVHGRKPPTQTRSLAHSELSKLTKYFLSSFCYHHSARLSLFVSPRRDSCTLICSSYEMGSKLQEMSSELKWKLRCQIYVQYYTVLSPSLHCFVLLQFTWSSTRTCSQSS